MAILIAAPYRSVKKNGKGGFIARQCGLLLAMALGLAGCNSNTDKTSEPDDTALIEAGYARTIRFISIAPAPKGQVDIIGITMPNGRVRWATQSGSFGFTADGNGRFHAQIDVPQTGQLFDLSFEDQGRLISAEGPVFIPGSRDMILTLRPGASPIIITERLDILCIDQGLGNNRLLSGLSSPNAKIELKFLTATGREIQTLEAKSDEAGRYSISLEHWPYGVGQIMVISGQMRHLYIHNAQEVRYPNKIDQIPSDQRKGQIEAFDHEWYITWPLTGSGWQTTRLFRAQ